MTSMLHAFIRSCLDNDFQTVLAFGNDSDCNHWVNHISTAFNIEYHKNYMRNNFLINKILQVEFIEPKQSQFRGKHPDAMIITCPIDPDTYQSILGCPKPHSGCTWQICDLRTAQEIGKSYEQRFRDKLSKLEF